MWTSSNKRESRLGKSNWKTTLLGFVMIVLYAGCGFTMICLFSGCGFIPQAKSFDVRNDLGEMQHFDCTELSWSGNCKSWTCMRCVRR